MKQATATVEELRAAGVTHPVTSRSYARWAGHLRPLLSAKGIPDACFAAGRNGVHIQQAGDGYLFVFHEPNEGPARDAAQRTAAAAVFEQQGKAMARKSRKRSSADA